MKSCSKCRNTLPLSQFYESHGKYSSWCKPCARAINRASYNRSPEVRRQRNQRVAVTTRARRLGLTYEQYVALPCDPGEACAVCGSPPDGPRNGHFRSGTHPDPKARNLAIDHDHTTGAIRGFLCSHCNRALGLMDDDPALLRKLAEYVEDGGLGWEPLPPQKPGRKRTAPPKERKRITKAERGCIVEGCDRPHYGLGWCRSHWRRWKRWGDPLAGRRENGVR